MHRRPWPLVIIAIFQVLTPALSVLFNAWVLRVSPAIVLRWMIDQPVLRVFEALALMPIAGISIYLMKKWSYALFFVALVWSIEANLRNAGAVPAGLPSAAPILVYLLEAGLAVYFLLPSVRATYFNASIRWWEAQPRYRLSFPATLAPPQSTARASDAQAVRVLNLSAGGALLAGQAFSAPYPPLRLEFSILGRQYSAAATVVHSGSSGGEAILGVMFDHDSQSRRQFEHLARALQLLGFDETVAKRTWYADLGAWTKRTLTTGQGIVPDLPPSVR